ncbi:MAG: hypothetical protein JO180_12110 [Gemmatirosa sp.]|nr:hypothetical protein [Gemmatirosa sp.]
MPTYHEVAQRKPEIRRAAAQPAGQSLAGDQLNVLNAIGETLFNGQLGQSDRDYETAAVGHLVGQLSRILVVACKAVTAPTVQAVQQAAKPYYGDIPDFGIPQPDGQVELRPNVMDTSISKQVQHPRGDRCF